jgi:hypothetical protein
MEMLIFRCAGYGQFLDHLFSLRVKAAVGFVLVGGLPGIGVHGTGSS